VWEVDPQDVRIGDKLGEGFFGEVFRATWRQQEVVVKRLKPGVRGEGADAERENFRRELGILVQLRHPRVVQFVAACTMPDNMFICLEYLAGGSLHDLIYSTNPPLKLQVQLGMLIDVASGMCYLHGHEPPIIHRDLTVHNILVDESGRCKVSDFGLSRPAAANMSALPGNLIYSAPEVLEESNYCPKADVYSFAICTFELLARAQPFDKLTVFQICKQVPGPAGLRPDATLVTPASMRKLVTACWTPQPETRPDFPRIIQALVDMKNGRVPPHGYAYQESPRMKAIKVQM